MKKTLLQVIVALLALTAVCGAAPNEINITAVPTNTTASTAENDIYLNGELDGIWIDVSWTNGTQTGTVVFVTAPTAALQSQTIITVTNLTADTVLRPRVIAFVNNANGSISSQMERYRLKSEKIQMQAYSCTATNQDIRASIRLY